MIPSSNKLMDIDPGKNPSITGPGADFIGSGSMTTGLLAWTGGVWDDDTGTFWIPLGGGHTDYGGNEPYRIKLSDESPTWVMVRRPTGAIGNEGVTRDGQERSGVYFDGRLRAVHSYNNQTFVPGLGPVISRLQGCYPNGHPASKRVAYRLNDAGEAQQICDYTAQNASNPLLSTDDGTCAYDPTRGARGTLWSLGNDASKLIQIDLSAGTAQARGETDNHLASCDALHYIPGMDVLAGITRGQLKIWHIDQNYYTPIKPTLSGSYSGGLEIANLMGFGSCWAPELRQLCLYENPVNSLGQISTLTPTGGATNPWVRGVLNVSSSNTVLPPAFGSNGGLFGRFGYSSKMRGFFLIPSTRHNPYFFATE